MQIRQLEYVREIAACGSITQAAQKLYISQQAVSEMLKLLEEELGFRIFERSSRGVKPTKNGQKFLLDLEKILPIVHSWDSLKDTAHRSKSIKIWLQYNIKDLLTNSSLTEYTSEIIGANIEWNTDHALNLLEQTMHDNDAISILNIIEDGNAFKNAERAAALGEINMEVLLKNRMGIVFAKDSELSEKEILAPKDLQGKHLVHNHAFGQTPHLKNIIANTNTEGILLPETVNIMEYLLRHKDTFSYIPEMILKHNYYIAQKLLNVSYLSDDKPYWLCVAYHKNNDEIYAQTVEAVLNYCEIYAY